MRAPEDAKPVVSSNGTGSGTSSSAAGRGGGGDGGSGVAQRMYKDIENWALDSGAVALFMIALHNDNVERMAKLYKRSGFGLWNVPL
jgi:hypothetical protein